MKEEDVKKHVCSKCRYTDCNGMCAAATILMEFAGKVHAGYTSIKESLGDLYKK